MIRIACVSDVHSPKFFNLFHAALKRIEQKAIDLFLLAGDMIYKGDTAELYRIIEALEDFNVKFPVYACFGNEEYDNLYDKLREIGKGKIIFLEDELIGLVRKRKRIGLVGTKGSLAKPTWWQARNIPNIQETYQNRIKKVEAIFANMKEFEVRILLSHYATTYKTVVGEPERAYPQMGTRAFEKVILNPMYKIDAVFHGHAHKGRKFALLKSRIPVYNVAVPLRKAITVVDVPRAPGRGSLLSYLT